MSDELKAARERLRRLDSGEPYYEIYGCVPTMHGHQQRDEKKILDNDLAEHPADEDELLTEEWLRSVGAEVLPYGGYAGGWEADFEWSDCWRLRIHDDGVCLISDGCPDGGIKWPVKITMRFQLRRLCASLHIPLTEPGVTKP